jgi:tetratricopeptide (TPR) repeat protein
MKSAVILFMAILTLINTTAQRNLDSGRGTESTKTDRIKRIRSDNSNQPKIVEYKERKPNIRNNFVQPSGEIGICGGVVPGEDTVICTETSPELYSDLDINSKKSLNNLGLQKFEEGNYYGAIAIFDKEINLNPNVKELYFWRGKTFLAVKEFKKAIKDFSTAITFDNYYSEAYYQRGLARFYSGERRKSKEDLKFAYSLGYSRAGHIINKYF